MSESSVCKKVKEVIFAECDMRGQTINRNTKFMTNHGLSYFDCMNTLYTLQHVFHISLPESDFEKYKTVGGLTRCVIKQLKARIK